MKNRTVKPHLETLIITHERRGKGVEDDLSRGVLQIHTTDGEFVAENDPCQGDAAYRETEKLKHRISQLESCLQNYIATVAELKAKKRK